MASEKGLGLNDLLPLKEAQKDPETYWRMSQGVIQYKNYCSAVMFLPHKFKQWCDHLGCQQNLPSCTPQPKPTAFPTLAPTSLITSTLSSIVRQNAESKYAKQLINCYHTYVHTAHILQ